MNKYRKKIVLNKNFADSIATIFSTIFVFILKGPCPREDTCDLNTLH